MPNSACTATCPEPGWREKVESGGRISGELPSSSVHCPPSPPHPARGRRDPHPSHPIQRGQSLAVLFKSSPKQSLCYCTSSSLYFVTYLFSFLQFFSSGIDSWYGTDRRVCEKSELYSLVGRQKSMKQRLLYSK